MVLRRLLFQRTGFLFKQIHTGTFLWILMPVSTTLASQELLRPSPKSCSLCAIFSAPEWGIAVPQGILTTAFSAGPVHGSLGTPSGHQEKGHAHMWQLPLCQSLRGTPDSTVSDGKEASKALGSGLSLYTLW
jgi:hypothetical protein